MTPIRPSSRARAARRASRHCRTAHGGRRTTSMGGRFGSPRDSRRLRARRLCGSERERGSCCLTATGRSSSASRCSPNGRTMSHPLRTTLHTFAGSYCAAPASRSGNLTAPAATDGPATTPTKRRRRTTACHCSESRRRSSPTPATLPCGRPLVQPPQVSRRCQLWPAPQPTRRE